MLGVVLVNLTGWLPLDPLVAIAVAGNIVWAGWRLLRETANGLLDIGWPIEQRQQLDQLIEPYRRQGLQFHALRTRIAGQRRFVSMHVLVPGEWSVRRGHALCEDLELHIRSTLAHTTVFTHLEPLEDASSWADQALDRASDPAQVR